MPSPPADGRRYTHRPRGIGGWARYVCAQYVGRRNLIDGRTRFCFPKHTISTHRRYRRVRGHPARCAHLLHPPALPGKGRWRGGGGGRGGTVHRTKGCWWPLSRRAAGRRRESRRWNVAGRNHWYLDLPRDVQTSCKPHIPAPPAISTPRVDRGIPPLESEGNIGSFSLEMSNPPPPPPIDRHPFSRRGGEGAGLATARKVKYVSRAVATAVAWNTFLCNRGISLPGASDAGAASVE